MPSVTPLLASRASARVRPVGALWRLRGYLKPFRTQMIVMLAAALGAVAAEIAIPLLTKSVIDGAIAHGARRLLLPLALAAAGLGAAEGLLNMIRRWIQATAVARIEKSIRDDLYAHLQQLQASFHDQWQSGQLLSRATTDLSSIRRFAGFGLIFMVTNVMVFVAVVSSGAGVQVTGKPSGEPTSTVASSVQVVWPAQPVDGANANQPLRSASVTVVTDSGPAGDGPALATLIVCVPVVSSSTTPESTVAVTSIVAFVPVPVSATSVVGAPNASLVIASVAVRVPDAVGANVTWICAALPAGMSIGVAVVIAKSPGFAPDSDSAVMKRSSLPVFDTGMFVDVVPWMPNRADPVSTLAGALMTGPVPVPVAVNEPIGLPPASTSTVHDSAPSRLGVNVTAIGAGMSRSSVADDGEKLKSAQSPPEPTRSTSSPAKSVSVSCVVALPAEPTSTLPQSTGSGLAVTACARAGAAIPNSPTTTASASSEMPPGFLTVVIVSSRPIPA